MITAIYDNLDISAEDVLFYLGQNGIAADNKSQAEVERLIKSVKRRADQYVQREAEYFEHNGSVEIPEDIEQWVYGMVARIYERRANAESQRSVNGAESVHWEDEDFRSCGLIATYLGRRLRRRNNNAWTVQGQGVNPGIYQERRRPPGRCL